MATPTHISPKYPSDRKIESDWVEKNSPFMARPSRNIVTIDTRRIKARHRRPSRKWPRPGTSHAPTHSLTSCPSPGRAASDLGSAFASGFDFSATSGSGALFAILRRSPRASRCVPRLVLHSAEVRQDLEDRPLVRRGLPAQRRLIETGYRSGDHVRTLLRGVEACSELVLRHEVVSCAVLVF